MLVDLELSKVDEGFGLKEAPQSKDWIPSAISKLDEEFDKSSYKSSKDPLDPPSLTSDEKKKAFKFIVNAVANFSFQQSEERDRSNNGLGSHNSRDINNALHFFIDRFKKVYDRNNGLRYFESKEVLTERSWGGSDLQDQDRQWAVMGAVMGLLFRDSINGLAPSTKVYLIGEMIEKNPEVREYLSYSPELNKGRTDPQRYWPLHHILALASGTVGENRGSDGQYAQHNFMQELSSRILDLAKPAGK